MYNPRIVLAAIRIASLSHLCALSNVKAKGNDCYINSIIEAAWSQKCLQEVENMEQEIKKKEKEPTGSE